MGETTKSWESLLRSADACDHLVQVYVEDDVLVRALSHFVGSGIARGDGILVIATPAHTAALTARIAAAGVPAGSPDRAGFVSIDAQRCLDSFIVDGLPDRTAFRSAMIPALDRLRAAGYPRIRLYGEMVNLLFRHHLEAAVRLEELWGELVVEYRACLLCAYRIDPLDAIMASGLADRIMPIHSRSFSEVARDDGQPRSTAPRYGLSMPGPAGGVLRQRARRKVRSGSPPECE